MSQVLDGYVRLVDTLGSDLSVVNAARVSYDKESEDFSAGDKRLLDFLMREGHTSPFRHTALTFEVYAPLFVARQWWKHAVASTHIDDQNGWNESSRRYITEEEKFYIPTVWRSKPENSKQGSGAPVDVDVAMEYTLALINIVAQGENWYQTAIDEGIAPEQARLFLPAYGMYVRWRWTASLQSVFTFLEQRLEHDAQWEIQQYAEEVSKLTEEAFPESYSAWKSNR